MRLLLSALHRVVRPGRCVAALTQCAEVGGRLRRRDHAAARRIVRSGRRMAAAAEHRGMRAERQVTAPAQRDQVLADRHMAGLAECADVRLLARVAAQRKAAVMLDAAPQIVHLAAQLRIVPVQIRLLFREEMEVIFASRRILLPGRSRHFLWGKPHQPASRFVGEKDVCICIRQENADGRVQHQRSKTLGFRSTGFSGRKLQVAR